jgi:hypothetical protein
MELILSGDEVLSLEEVKTQNQTAIIKKHYCFYKKLVLQIDDKKLLCKVYNYLDEFQEDNNDIIYFNCGGEVIEKQAENGIAELELDIQTNDLIVIKTANKNMDNSEVKINE